MDLEYVAAQAFLNELVKIANDTEDSGTKTAAMTLYGEMTVEEVASVIKEAGIIGGLTSAGAGLIRGGGRMLGGAVSSGLSQAGGLAKGVAGRIHQAGSNAVNAVSGAVSRAGQAVAAAPANFENRMKSFGQRMEATGTARGQAMSQAGAQKGEAIRQRVMNGPPPTPVPAIQPARPGQVMSPAAAAPAAAPAVPELGSAPVGNVQSPFQDVGASQAPPPQEAFGGTPGPGGMPSGTRLRVAAPPVYGTAA